MKKYQAKREDSKHSVIANAVTTNNFKNTNISLVPDRNNNTKSLKTTIEYENDCKIKIRNLSPCKFQSKKCKYFN